MSRKALDRRRFLTSSATLAGGALFAPNLIFGQTAESANNKLRIACIGIGGKGESDTGNAAIDNDIVAIVDIDSDRLAKAQLKYPGAKTYSDYRKMFAEMADKIDAVTISTPDHTHFPAAMMAVALKKHIMVQKPMCNTIWEVRELHKAAKAAGVVTQMGNQGRTMEGQRLAKEWVEQGAIGTLKEIQLWTNRPIWPQGPLEKKLVDKPATLDWDGWLGTEPMEPYFEYNLPAEQLTRGKGLHPFNWRGWWQFGSGALGDMGCHIMDATFSILGQAIPIKIEAESSEITDLNAPVWSTLKYYFAPGPNNPEPLVVTWRDGSKEGVPNKPEKPEFMKELSDEGWKKASSGMMFIGTEGVVYEGEAYCASPSVYPAAKFLETKQAMVAGKIKKTEARSPKPGEPQQEWTHIIKNGGTTSSNFDYAAPLTEFVLLGNLAIRTQKTIQWDKEGMKVSNEEAANKFVKRPSYRAEYFKA